MAKTTSATTTQMAMFLKRFGIRLFLGKGMQHHNHHAL
jgi:hypothetical protein